MTVIAAAARTNADLMADCATLGYLDGSVLDLTYATGRFWRKHRPFFLVTNDIDVEMDADRHLDATCTGLEAKSFDTVVFDPPYKLNGTSTGKGPAASDVGYGVGGPYVTAAGRHGLLVDGTVEALRLARRFVLVKCMDQICSGSYHPQTFIAYQAAVATGARLVDQLHVLGGRAQPNGRRQVHARRNYSTLLVFGAPA